MLSDHLISLIEASSSSLCAASCTPDLDTEIIRLTGARVAADRLHIDLYCPERFTSIFLSHVSRQPNISIVISSVPTFETYQIKGSHISTRQSTVEEGEIQRHYIKGFGLALMHVGLRNGYRIETYCQEPGVVIRLKAEEIYEQTPRKGTGNRIG
jgi:hypothetical protein